MRSEPDLAGFHQKKEALLRQFAKAAFDAATDVSLSAEGAEAAEVTADPGPKMEAADPL